MFCIGRVTTWEEDRNGYLYGIISPISPEYRDDVRFWQRDIFTKSILKQDNSIFRKYPIVGYFLKTDILKPDKEKAVWVILLEEINPNVLFKLINAYGLGGNELTSVMEDFLPYYNFGNDPMEYLRFIKNDLVKDQLIQKASSHLLEPSFSEALVNCLEAANLSSSFTWRTEKNIDDIISLPIYEYESEESVERLCIYIKRHYRNKDISPIINRMPESFLLREEILKLIGGLEIKNVLTERIVGNEKLLESLTLGLKDKYARETAIDYLPVETIMKSPELIAVFSDEKMSDRIIALGDFTDDEIADGSKNNELVKKTEEISALISAVEPVAFPKAAVALGEMFLRLNLPIFIWKQMHNAEKVWFVLYLSLQLENRADWIKSFGELYKYEKSKEVKNNCVLAVNEYLAIALTNDEKKQKLFDSAHILLEKAVVADFETLGEPSIELLQLICRCKDDDSMVCPARYWKKQKTAWCNLNRESCGKFNARDKEGLDYTKTKYQYCVENQHSNALCTLSMADLLNNIKFIPTLENVYSPVFNYKWGFEEYPYRISGRILQLCRFYTHMRCKCGKTMKSNYAFSVKIDSRMSITRAYCPDSQGVDDNNHDNDVYLNECWNCDEVIDSRECHFIQTKDGKYYPKDQDENGYYVCMNCGAGYKDMLPSVCPSCGCADQELLEYRYITENPPKRKLVKCNHCGYSWEPSPMEKELLKNRNDSVSENAFSVDWDEMPDWV